MYRGINIFQFYTNDSERRWNNTNSDIKENCVIFQNGKIPPFMLYTDVVMTDVVAKLINVNNPSIYVTFDCAVVVAENGFKLIKFLGDDLETAIPDGYYYINLYLTPNGYSVNSEVFGILTNVYTNNLLKINVQTSNVTLSGIHNVPLSEITSTEFFLFINGISLTGEINEDGVEKPYGNIPVFNTLNIKHIVEVNCTNDIVKYLHTLRIFETNGIIKISQANITTSPEVYGIEISIKDEYNFGDHTIVELTFREKDFISTRNAI